MQESDVLFTAFGLTLFAGLSTGIGGLIAFAVKQQNWRFLTLAMGFAAGVMIYVSFADLYVEAQESLMESMGEVQGLWTALFCFLGGMVLVMFLDRVIPDVENPHEMENTTLDQQTPLERRSRLRLLRVGVVLAATLALHNLPEGMATFMATIKDPSLGVLIAIAIAIHNIPEGIAVSMPVYYATGSRWKAFNYSFLSGLAEPLGALLAYLLLMPYLSDQLFGMLFSAIAGIMVFISLDQLLPAAREYGEHRLALFGLVLGMAVMGLSTMPYSA